MLMQEQGQQATGDPAASPLVRAEPYVMLLDHSSGFVVPNLPTVPSSMLSSDSEPDLAAAPTFAGSARPPARSYSSPGHKEFGSNSPSSTFPRTPLPARFSCFYSHVANVFVQLLPSCEAKCAETARSDHTFIADMHLHQLAALPAGALQRLHEEMVAEHRMRLIAGLKRYFHRKRHEGLLSTQGLRLLDNACDTCTDEPLNELDVFAYMHMVRPLWVGRNEVEDDMVLPIFLKHGFRTLKSRMLLQAAWRRQGASVPRPEDS